MRWCVGEYLERQKTVHQPTFDPARKKALVIVETRASYWLPKVIANAVEHHPDWNLYVFGTAEVLELVTRTCGDGFRGVRLTGPLDVDGYSQLLMSSVFWDFLADAEHALIFQTDCVFVRGVRPEHLEFDMIGAVCGKLDSFTMNGGLSLRRVSTMRQIVAAIKDEERGDPEDKVFTRHLKATKGANLPSMKACNEFVMETLGDASKVIGIHGTDKEYISSETMLKVLSSV